jgi:nucleotide-binding universal stress UspA family protein
LIVVGSQGRSALGRLVLGSVSQAVVTHARCSVRVARDHGAEANRPVRIIIGVDGSAASLAAVRAVAERSWPPDSDVRVISAIDASLSTSVELPALQEWTEPDDAATHPENKDAWVDKMVASVANTLRSAGLNVSTHIQKGDPKKVLIDEAERWGADCIFVGARGLNRIERLLLGSVSTAVATRARCSVEVVRSASAFN